MAKKTYNQKLQDAKDLPRIEDLSDNPKSMERFKGSKMLIAAPMQYNAIMAKVPEGKVVTSEAMRAHLAKEAGADVTCPLTAGIFINICAHASCEREDNPIPYWRTLKAKGELNEKFPGGMDAQQQLLENEGHEVIQKGKRIYMKDYEDKQWVIQ